MSWLDDAACRDVETSVFFPERGESDEEAKMVCVGCPVKAECLEWALSAGIRHGVFGGLSERQRRQFRQRSVIPRCCRFCGDRFIPDDAKVRYCSKLCERAMQTERQRVRRAS